MPLLPTFALVASLLACSGAADDTASTDDTAGAGGLTGVPPFPAVNSATIRTADGDITFPCFSRASGFFLVNAPSESDPDQQALAIYCDSDDADPSNLAAFRYTDIGHFEVGTYDDDDETAGRTLQVTVIAGGGATIADTSTFESALVIEALGAPGEHAIGTFQATWPEVRKDLDGDGTYEAFEEPGGLAIAYDFLQD